MTASTGGALSLEGLGAALSLEPGGREGALRLEGLGAALSLEPGTLDIGRPESCRRWRIATCAPNTCPGSCGQWGPDEPCGDGGASDLHGHWRWPHA